MNPSQRFSKKRLRKSPSGKKVMKFKVDKPAKATCAVCKTKLHGVPNRKPSEMSKLAKTEKRPERMFGGVLCHSCTQSIVKEKARLAAGSITRKEIDVRHLRYL